MKSFMVLSFLTLLGVAGQASENAVASMSGLDAISSEVFTTELRAVGEQSAKYPRAVVVLSKDQITLQLIPPMIFCVRAPCPQLERTVVQLPIVRIKHTMCGDVYFAKKDLRLVDGSLQQIKLVDYREMLCKMYVSLEHKTIVTYSVTTSGQDGSPKTYTQRYYGPALAKSIDE